MAELEERSLWCLAFFSLLGRVAEEKGWYDATDVGIGIVRHLFSEEAMKIVQSQKLVGKEMPIVRQVWEGFAKSSLPSWELRERKTEAEGTTLRLQQLGTCPMWEAVKELGVQDELPVYRICQAACTGLVQQVNPDLIVSLEKGMCEGNDLCEFLVEKIPEFEQSG